MAHPQLKPPVTGPERTTFQPYVSASQSPAEFTARAVILGSLFGLLFGASTVYLGLRAGLTVAASIPIAVLAISVLKKLGGSTILENNIVQTIGSAGESIAGGVVFTVPALIFLTPDGPRYFNYVQITMLTFAGGILGVLMMVPLRRALIVKEHGVLPYPEGTACAEVLVAGERGGKLASLVFAGVGVGALWKALSWIFNVFRTDMGYSMPRTSQFPNATLNVDVSPEYLGVGYVIGPRIAGTMFAGGVLSWLVLLPLLSILGSFITVPFPPIHPNYANNPATGQPFLISQMSPTQLWSAYIRYIGAGAVLASGLITLGRTIPTIISSAREGMRDFAKGAGGAGQIRTERDIPMTVVIGGSLLLGVFLAVVPTLPTYGNPLAAVLILIFGFFFATVSSRITGLIGTSSNPISGMTIATLILTCLLFVALGWTGDMYSPIAIGVGAIVCIAAANAGNTSQDLKTGFIVGATPLYQQIGLVIGVIASASVIGLTLLYLHNNLGGIGSENLAAPQATLMATIIKGLLNQNLPWGLVLIGVFLSVALELCGIRSLSFAVGSYLPIATTAPIFAGGLVRAWVEARTGKAEESELSSGTLFSSGLIAGGSLAGILFAVLVGTGSIGMFQAVGNGLTALHSDGVSGQVATALLFLALAVIVARTAMRKVE
ncbi:MAG TPA: oligopeptide transporter, OPT family [Vicinamibacterales bacterium]|jgi:putative OPT family oligopeptide transporter|nr:oligopeptide transporter, OPT family [Vicinamibacterales bacterium]